MAMFTGTIQKCKACEKTVYLMDELTADNKVYHKACFRCHHCKGTLKLSNYSSFEGVLYCKPHFDQLFKMTGSLDKSFEGTPKTIRVDRSAEQGSNNRRVLNMFGGTQEKCVACKKTVYPLEKVPFFVSKKGLLWCPEIYYGGWSKGMRGDFEWKASCTACQVNEVQGRVHDIIWTTCQRQGNNSKGQSCSSASSTNY